MRDRMRRLSVATPTRMANLFRLHQSYRQAKRTGLPHMHRLAMPSSISIEPTTSCNLRCPECPSGLRSFSRPTGMLDVNKAKTWIHELAPWLTYVNLYFQGEPLLHPELATLVERCTESNLYTSTSTNAHHLSQARCQELIDAGLNRLIISIDGLTQESYSAYRIGGHLDKVMEGTSTMLEAKKKTRSGPHLVWQFLVVGTNEHELPELFKAAERCGVHEVVVKTAQIDNPEDGHPLLTENPKHRRYDRDSRTGKWRLRNSLEDACWRMWQGTVMTWDGRVVPCCFDKDAHHVLGSLEEQSMKQIWHGDSYRLFRQTLFQHRSGIPMCTNCSEGSHVYV